jgi:hypothetical protein
MPVALAAREATKSLRLKRLREQLDYLAQPNVGMLAGGAPQALYNTVVGENYKPRGVRGHGAYSLPGMVGDAVRGYMSGGGLGAASALAHDIIPHRPASTAHHPFIWEGSGAYQAANKLISTSPATSLHVTSGLNELGDIQISHREYLCDVIPTIAGFQTIASYYINPGLSASFPWFSQIAQFYEEYEMIQCLYTFESMVTEGNQNSQGSLIMATQYNPANALFNNKVSMEQYDAAQSYKVTHNAVHGVECDPTKRAGSAAEYIRTGPVPSGQDIKSFDLGLFQLACQGCTPNLFLGELWVTYTVKLSKAKIPVPGTISYPTVTASIANVGAPTRPNWLGLATGIRTLFSLDSTNPAGNTQATSGFSALFDGFRTFIYFNPQINTGTYLFDYRGSQASAAGQNPAFGALVNCVITTAGQAAAGTAITAFMGNFVVNVTGPNAMITFEGNGITVAAPNGTTLNVVQLNPNVPNFLA